MRLWISYDGTDFAGWQRQAGAETVQEHIERAVAVVCQSETTVHGSGRTDSGVHALGQIAHLRLEKGPAIEIMPRALNSMLPPDIRVWHAREVPLDFHARFSARSKRYVYRVLSGPTPDPLLRRFGHFSGYELDLGAMREAASLLYGEHDFAAFSANPGKTRVRSTVRKLTGIHIRKARHGFDFSVQGNGFLYNMVRILVGSLLEVGRGKCPPAWIMEVLRSKDRCMGGPTLPPQGLFLIKALYPPNCGSEPRRASARKSTLAG